MAEERDRQGTGRHPHRSSDEPYAHTREKDRDEGGHHTRAEHHSGAHAKDDTRGSDDENRGARREHEISGARQGSAHAQGGRAEEQDLKRREYRDDKGEVHHHTKTYMEQHRDEKK